MNISIRVILYTSYNNVEGLVGNAVCRALSIIHGAKSRKSFRCVRNIRPEPRYS